MALCGGVGAMALPSELIVHIFSFLSDRDKLRASAVCSRWRECLFYPALWTELKLRIGGGSNSGGASSEENLRLEFLIRKFGSFVRDLQLELAPIEGYVGPPNNDASATRMDQLPGPDGNQQLPERWRDAVTTYLDQVLCVFTGIRNNR